MATEKMPSMPNEEEAELERLVRLAMEHNGLDRETALKVAEISLMAKKKSIAEKKRFPGGKYYEGRDSD